MKINLTLKTEISPVLAKILKAIAENNEEFLEAFSDFEYDSEEHLKFDVSNDFSNMEVIVTVSAVGELAIEAEKFFKYED